MLIDNLSDWPIHAILMLVGIALIGAAAIIARKKKKITKWMIKHKITAILGVFSCLAGLGLGIRMVGENFNNHINSIHSVFGLISISFLSFTPLIGQFIFWTVKKKRPPKKIRSIRLFHKWIGRITILIVIITISLGTLRLFF